MCDLGAVTSGPQSVVQRVLTFFVGLRAFLGNVGTFGYELAAQDLRKSCSLYKNEYLEK